MSRAALRTLCFVAILAVPCGVLASGGCTTVREVRIQNASKVDYTGVRVAGQHYGDIAAGATSDYRPVEMRFRYAAIELEANGEQVTGQTLNFGSRRFTYCIDLADLEAGHLAIDVVRD